MRLVSFFWRITLNLRLLSRIMSKLNTCKERQVSTLNIIFLKGPKIMDLLRSLLKADRSFTMILSFYFLFKMTISRLQRWYLSNLFSWIKPVCLGLTLRSHSKFPPRGHTIRSHSSFPHQGVTIVSYLRVPP